jgi:hypothetical protein
MKHKVSELEGPLLDAAVAMAEGLSFAIESWQSNPPRPAACWLTTGGGLPDYGQGPYSPPTSWQQGGPIIERERILLSPLDGEWRAVHTPSGHHDDAEPFDEYAKSFGPTPRVAAHGHTALIAAMRARVASRFGDEVELP